MTPKNDTPTLLQVDVSSPIQDKTHLTGINELIKTDKDILHPKFKPFNFLKKKKKSIQGSRIYFALPLTNTSV